MSEVRLTINGKEYSAERGGSLLSYLREELGLVGTKNGCGTGECGSCTVLVDGSPRRACTVGVEKLDGVSVTTIEGVAAEGALHPIQDALLRHGAVQCGFCTPGMVLAIKGLLDRTSRPTTAQIRSGLQGNICRCTGYLPFVRAIEELVAAGEKTGSEGSDLVEAAATAVDLETVDAAPGKSPRKKDALPKVRGERLFADDYAAPGQIYGAFAFSEIAHARIRSVDASAAEAVEGVEIVLTAKDLPGRNGYGLMVPHQPVFAEGEVRYRGEITAAVFAESEEIARRAVALISVDYEPLAAQMDPVANMAEGAAQLHSDGNIAEHYDFVKGDPDKAFREADVVIEGEYETPSVEHAYLEPEACLAVPAGAEGPAPAGEATEVTRNEPPSAGSEASEEPIVTVYTYNQGSYRFREMIAASLDIAEESVRVVYTPCGGGFGGKEEPAVQIPCALAAVRTGRAVKIHLNREESIRISTKRHAAKIRMKHAAKKDGTITAVSSEAVCDAGAYMSLTQPVVFRATVMASGPYEIPNVRAEAWGVYTTKNPSGAFRGFGSTQVTFAAEVQMDRLAAALGITPLELRKRHALAPGRVNAFGHRLSKGVGYLGTLEAIATELKRLEPEIDALKSRAGAGRIGVGVASSYKNVGLGKGVPDGAGAKIEVTETGMVTVYVGATDMGQGSDTVFAQLAAAELGLPYEAVEVVSSDTARCPDGGMTTASRQTFVTGNAVLAAAGKLKRRLTSAGDEVRLEAFQALAAKNGGVLREEAWYDAPKTYPLQHLADERAGVPEEEFGVHFGYCFSSQAAIIEVDPETGSLTVHRIIAAQDAGRVLHRQNVIGQIEGGVMMGVGYALQESYTVDEEGKGPKRFKDLGVVRIKDMPAVTSFIVEEPHPDGPFEAKGLGEVPLNPTAPAIANAIGSALGSYPNRLPIRISAGPRQ